MLRALAIWPVLALLAQPLWADARMTVLVDLLQLKQVAAVLRSEGLDHAETLRGDMLQGQAGAGWQIQIDAIYDTSRMVETVRTRIEAEVQGALRDDCIDFYASDLGSEVITLENAARAAISDDDVEDAARARFAAVEGTDDPRLALIEQLIADGDMVNRNVTAAMNSNYQFLRGLADGGGLEMTEAEMLDDVTAQQAEITEDTIGWLHGYMLLAYSPLSDAELETYVAFAASDAGQALNRGLFDGFGAAYAEISYALGQTVALNMTAEEL